MAISFSGIGSGIDSESLITSLVTAEKQPETAMQTAQSNLKTQISTLGKLVTQLQSLGTAASALSTANEIQAPTATSSNTSIVGVSATAAAAAGTYRITIDHLAQAQSTVSTGFDSDTAGIAGTGSATLTVGTGQPVTVSYGASDTLDSIAASINQQVAGVSASVVFDGSKYRIVVNSTSTGAANTIQFSESGNALGFTAAKATVQPAQDASFTINGLAMTRASNTVTDALNGVTLNLTSETPVGGTPTTVSIATDAATLQKRAQSILDAYNTVVKTIDGQMNYTGTSLGPNTLFGDTTVQGLQLGLGTLAAQSYTWSGGKSSLADLGITLQADGTLSLDSTTFTNAVTADPSALQHLLIGDGSGGLVGALNDTVKNYTQYGTGMLVTEQTAKQSQIKGYDQQIAAIEDRASSLETTLRSQFTTLDSVMAQYKSQQSYLTSLFASSTSSSR